MQVPMQRPRTSATPAIPQYHQYQTSCEPTYEQLQSQDTKKRREVHESPQAATSSVSATTRKRKSSSSNVPVVVDLTADSPPSMSPKRKVSSAPLHASKRPKRDQTSGIATETPEKQTKKPEKGEKRMRRWRNKPPTDYLVLRERALTQRMYVVDRQRSSNLDFPAETVTLIGSTGNIYTVVIDSEPSCDCPWAKKGNQCKHIAYVLSRVLQAPDHLEYQLAFLSDELREIFQKAPPLPSETAEEERKDGNRKPIEGDCPICCVEFEPDSGETIVYCRASCGNNIHEECFSQWATTKGGGNIPCPFCRTPWQDDEKQLKQVASTGKRNAEGYVNVASQVGLSGRRDYSTYHSHWVRQQAMRGRVSWDDDGVMNHEYY